MLVLWLALFEASAGTKDFQAASLEKYPGANEDLKLKLECLRMKVYPDDIEVCGLSGFGSAAYQSRIEGCLHMKRGNTVALSNAKLMLVVQCSRMRVAVEFEKNEGKYSVISINELLD
ncbi:hypothetical protein [Pseudoduganella sp. RAF19]|uniref:hypothetical protein n=1 Tax=Pseudoduganella sp. RAF19 TaxID=3233052 RepID=UPI003F950130